MTTTQKIEIARNIATEILSRLDSEPLHEGDEGWMVWMIPATAEEHKICVLGQCASLAQTLAETVIKDQ